MQLPELPGDISCDWQESNSWASSKMRYDSAWVPNKVTVRLHYCESTYVTWRMFWQSRTGLNINVLDAPSDVTSRHHSLHIGSNVLPENSCSWVDINQKTSFAHKLNRKRTSPAPSRCGTFVANVIPSTSSTSKGTLPKEPAQLVITGNVAFVRHSTGSCTKERETREGS